MSAAIIVTALDGSGRALPSAAGLAAYAAAEQPEQPAVLVDLESGRRHRAGMICTPLASTTEKLYADTCSQLGFAARGGVCFASPQGSTPAAETVDEVLSEADCGYPVIAVPDHRFRTVLERAARIDALAACVVCADRSVPGPLLGLLGTELAGRGVPLAVWRRGPGLIGTRRALAGLRPGGVFEERAARVLARARRTGAGAPGARVGTGQSGQALPALLGIAALAVLLTLALAALGGAVTAKGRAQRAVDLAALSAARSMRDDFSRLFVPARTPAGELDPRHLDREEYLERARSAARQAIEENGLGGATLTVRFQRPESFAPTGVEVLARAEGAAGTQPGVPRGAPERHTEVSVRVAATAELSPSGDQLGSAPESASGGGYSGPLSYRQGEGMRPDVASAFDRLSRAAAGSGVLTGDQLGVPFRRRAGEAVCRQPRPALGRSTGPFAASLRDRARPRSRRRLWLARRQCPEIRLRAAVLVGGLALREAIARYWFSHLLRCSRAGDGTARLPDTAATGHRGELDLGPAGVGLCNHRSLPRAGLQAVMGYFEDF